MKVTRGGGHSPMARVILGLTLLGVTACGSTNGPVVISVGGVYPTAVTLVQNSCGAVTVQPNPTTVTHTAGSTSVSLSHAATTYTGTLNPDATFALAPVTLNVAGQTLTIEIHGQFSTTGFAATVTIDVQQAAQPTTCRYVVSWSGTKNGQPNTIP